MNIFYGKSEGTIDVTSDSPIEASVNTALAIFRALEPKRGFIGVVLDKRFVLQLLNRKKGIQIELLDTSIPAFDFCLADSSFAEVLIRAAAEGDDVFQIARAGDYKWEHWDLSQSRQKNV